MKRLFYHSVFVFAFLSFFCSCRNTAETDAVKKDVLTQVSDSGLIVIAENIITEVILNPDTLGDPWEVEKVRGYNGKLMFDNLFKDIYEKRLTVYDCFTGEPLDPTDIKKMEKEYGYDISKIGKVQFTEDWYYDPAANSMNKRIKSISFGYETDREEDLPTRYKALFRLKTEE